MRIASIPTMFVATLIAISFITHDSRADFVRLDNFDAYLLGPIDEQGGWFAANETSAVVVDPVNIENQVLAVVTDSTHLHRAASLPEDTVRMLFVRMRLGGQQTYSVGLSGASVPTQFNDFDVEIGMANSTNELRINDDGSHAVLTVLQQNTWYNCWLFINNITADTQIYVHARDGEPALPSDQLDDEGQTIFVFRHGISRDLRTFYIKTGGGSGPSGPLYLDDIYIEDSDALNLQNPAALPCPADLSGDGTVDSEDWMILLQHWGDAGVADVDGDGFADADDLIALLLAWGACP